METVRRRKNAVLEEEKGNDIELHPITMKEVTKLK